MNDRVAVLGLGRMGAALAACLVARDCEVVVWNRTPAKAEPLLRAGARRADAPAEAVAAAEFVVICVGNYADTNQILAGCRDLQGRTVIQLTTGRAWEAAALRAWVEQRGGAYLDGSIIAYPSQIGVAGTMLVVAGAPSAWARSERIIRELGPASLYVGDDMSAPIAMGFALAIPSLMATLGMLLGFHALERAGVDPGVFAERLAGISGALTRDMARQARAILANDFSAPEASLGAWTAAFSDTWAPDLDGAVAASRGAAIGAMLRPLGELMSRGVDAGYGDEDLTALIKVLRAHA